MIERPAGGNGVQPGIEAGIPAKRGQLFPNGQPHLLANVAGVGFVVHDRANQPEDAFVVRTHDNPKGGLIARLCTVQQVGINIRGGGGSWGRHGQK